MGRSFLRTNDDISNYKISVCPSHEPHVKSRSSTHFAKFYVLPSLDRLYSVKLGLNRTNIIIIYDLLRKSVNNCFCKHVK